jgi:hypothetical protein
MSKKTTDEMSGGKKPVSETPFHKNHTLDAKLSIKNNPASKPWINNRVSDHDKSQTEKGRH